MRFVHQNNHHPSFTRSQIPGKQISIHFYKHWSDQKCEGDGRKRRQKLSGGGESCFPWKTRRKSSSRSSTLQRSIWTAYEPLAPPGFGSIDYEWKRGTERLREKERSVRSGERDEMRVRVWGRWERDDCEDRVWWGWERRKAKIKSSGPTEPLAKRLAASTQKDVNDVIFLKSASAYEQCGSAIWAISWCHEW